MISVCSLPALSTTMVISSFWGKPSVKKVDMINNNRLDFSRTFMPMLFKNSNQSVQFKHLALTILGFHDPVRIEENKILILKLHFFLFVNLSG